MSSGGEHLHDHATGRELKVDCEGGGISVSSSALRPSSIHMPRWLRFASADLARLEGEELILKRRIRKKKVSYSSALTHSIFFFLFLS